MGKEHRPESDPIAYVDLYRQREHVKQQIASASDAMQFDEWQRLTREFQGLNEQIFHILTTGEELT